MVSDEVDATSSNPIKEDDKMKVGDPLSNEHGNRTMDRDFSTDEDMVMQSSEHSFKPKFNPLISNDNDNYSDSENLLGLTEESSENKNMTALEAATESNSDTDQSGSSEDDASDEENRVNDDEEDEEEDDEEEDDDDEEDEDADDLEDEEEEQQQDKENSDSKSSVEDVTSFPPSKRKRSATATDDGEEEIPVESDEDDEETDKGNTRRKRKRLTHSDSDDNSAEDKESEKIKKAESRRDALCIQGYNHWIANYQPQKSLTELPPLQPVMYIPYSHISIDIPARNHII